MRLDQTPTRLAGVRLDYHSGGAFMEPEVCQLVFPYNLSALLCRLWLESPQNLLSRPNPKSLARSCAKGALPRAACFDFRETLGPQRGAEKYGKTVVTRSSGGHHVWHSNSKACSSRVHFSLYSTRRVSWSERYGEYSQSMFSG